MIIGISGYATSGKNTVATIMQYLLCKNVGINTIGDVVKDYKNHEWWLEEQSGWEQKSWAGKLKVVASLLTGISVEKFEDQEFKKLDLGEEWDRLYSISPSLPPERVPMTVRNLLQILGTDALRDNLHPNTWVNALMSDYRPYSVRGNSYEEIESNWIITDTRFPNEADTVRKNGGILIKVERKGVGPVNNHPSETSLENYDFDYIIHNDNGVKELEEKVSEMLRHFNFI